MQGVLDAKRSATGIFAPFFIRRKTCRGMGCEMTGSVENGVFTRKNTQKRLQEFV